MKEAMYNVVTKKDTLDNNGLAEDLENLSREVPKGKQARSTGLMLKLILALICGSLIGLYAPDWALKFTETGRIFLGNLIQYFVPLIIIFFITASIAEFGKDPGKILAYTIGISCISTLIACIVGATAAYSLVPVFSLTGSRLVEAVEIGKPFLQIEIPPIMNTLSALLLSFILGIGITWSKSELLKKLVIDGRNIILKVVEKLIIPLIPLFIVCIFAGLTAKGQISSIVSIFIKMLLLIIVLQFLWLLVQYTIAGAYSKENPEEAFRLMLPAFLTAFGTMSNTATMPVSLEQGKKLPNMKKEIAELVMPLCSIIHMSGTALTVTISVIAINFLTKGTLPPIGSIISFIILLTIVEVCSIGIPGGSIVVILGILTSFLAFGETELGLMVTMLIIKDSFGRATSIMGDGAIALIVNKKFGHELE